MKELLELCTETSEWLQHRPLPIHRHLRKDLKLKNRLQQIEERLNIASEIYRPSTPPPPAKLTLKAIAWNLERGKQFDSIVYHLRNDPDLREADLYFFTEVDWGMVRSGNRSVAEELGKLLNLYTYFSPSYFNLTVGHGGERHLQGKNAQGLHGKAILSRWPLTHLRTGPMPNVTDKFHSVEARIGQKRSLIGDLKFSNHSLTIGCIHLDAFSSPKARAQQMKRALEPLCLAPASLIAGDWNTNTMDSRSGRHVLKSLFQQLLLIGPRRMMQEHHLRPDVRFDRPVFSLLEELGFVYDTFNEIGIGTFDLLQNDHEVGAMARDQMPAWIVNGVHRVIRRLSDQLSLKLDWFAGKKIQPVHSKVVRLNPPASLSLKRPSDHHPILLSLKDNF